MNLFEKLFSISDTADSLDSFLKENIQSINELSNSVYKSIIDSKDSIERFILLKGNIIEHVDFQKSYNRAFISILLDFCERFNFISATPKIYSILEKNKINIGHRLQAALLFLYNIDCNSRLVERFELICEKIQTSIEFEEDNEKRAVSTFLNYYSIVIHDTHLEFAEQVKHKIKNAVLNDTYLFLKNPYILDALSFDLLDLQSAFNRIQSVIDFILEKTDFVEPFFEKEENEFLIEGTSEYSTILNKTSTKFKSIRKISVNKINEMPEKDEIYYSLGRGVSILQNESQMFSYMKSFGSAHHAKMLSALKNIPFNEIKNNVELFDWSCGQGLASMTFFEYLKDNSTNLNIESLTLIEPSIICLKRAALHARHFNKNCNITTICKVINSINVKDIISHDINTKIHFFSNILDVDDFSITYLIDLIEKNCKGINYFICVSPYITDIKTDRVDSFCRYFTQFDTFKLLAEKTNGGRQDDDYWNCNNKYRGCMCPTHPHFCNGKNKWTRVLRIFNVEI